MRLFAKADILVGMHGAGRTNAFLAPRGSVMIELKGWYKNENDLFRKIAQARWGGYVAVNMELASGRSGGATTDTGCSWTSLSRVSAHESAAAASGARSPVA